jgi:hypothetical protein
VKYIDADGAAYRPVIADFGISKLLSENPEAHNLMQNSMRVGTVTYMAPEQLRAKNLSYNADLWAFGIIMYEIITSKYMIARRSFPDLQREEAYTFWRNADEQRFPADMDSIPEPYQQIIRRCLLADPDERAQSTDELLSLLSLQPQLADVEKHLKKGNTAQAIDVLEAIEQRVTLPSIAQKLNELRLSEALVAPPATLDPIADRPVEIDENAVFVSVEPVLPMTPPVSPAAAADDYQRTQQFTEQFDPLDPALLPPTKPDSVFAAYQQPEPAAPQPAPKEKPKGKSKQPAKVIEETPADNVPTPDKAFEEETALTNVPEPIKTEVFADEPVAEIPPTNVSKSTLLTYTETFAEADSKPAYAPNDDDIAVAPPPVQAPPRATPTKPLGQPLPVREWADDLVSLSKEAYTRVRTDRKVRMAALGGVAFLTAFVLIFSSGSPNPIETGQQTSPQVSEDYRKALALFKKHQVFYEKTGELNPYLWAFIHCNPDYDDTLVNSAKIRAQTIGNYTQLLFTDHESNLTGYKRQEMKNMLVSKIAWEKMPHDPNCAPGQLLENENNK